MRFLVSLAASAVILSGATARAQNATVPNFKPLEFLVGHCWLGTFPDGKATDEHCFEWVFDHKFIRDRHIVRNGTGPYQGETLYGWDVKENRPTYWYGNSEGQIITGYVEYTPAAIVFPSHYDTPAGVVEIKAVWTVLGPDSYRIANSQKSGNEWKSLWTMEMKRK